MVSKASGWHLDCLGWFLDGSGTFWAWFCIIFEAYKAMCDVWSGGSRNQIFEDV